MTKDAGAWNKGSLADNYATGPNPETFSSIAGFDSMHHFLPAHGLVKPPAAILSLLMPAVLQRHDGEQLCIVKALELYRSPEVWKPTAAQRLDCVALLMRPIQLTAIVVQKAEAADCVWKFKQLLEVIEHCAIVLAQVRSLRAAGLFGPSGCQAHQARAVCTNAIAPHAGAAHGRARVPWTLGL